MASREDRIDIKDLLKDDLAAKLRSLSVKGFRAQQILEWVYRRQATSFDAMTNLAPGEREALKKELCVSRIGAVEEFGSKDGTRKLLFGLGDGERIESVYIPSPATNTVCVSSQVGCRFACAFCASGKGGLVRNLSPAEIVDQVMQVRASLPVTNVVVMGMGEPFDNYDNVLKAIRIMNAPYGLGIGQRKITVSTCGLIPGIKRFQGEGLQVELSVSLHGARDDVRSRLMPVNKKYPLGELIAACRDYCRKTDRQVTFEYVLMKGVNDSKKDARDVARLVRGMIAKVNLIACNAVECVSYAPPAPVRVREFRDALRREGIPVTLRLSRGGDIAAACGQLRLQHETK